MRRSLMLVSMVLVAGSVLVAWSSPQHSALQGAWLVQSWSNAEGETIDAQPGIYIFTSTHYSTMFVPGTESRAQYDGQQITEQEIVPAYRSFVANSGRYSVSGSEVTTHAYVAKDPNYMSAFPENAQTFTFAIEGETLTLTFPNGGSVTLRKVEGMQMQ